MSIDSAKQLSKLLLNISWIDNRNMTRGKLDVSNHPKRNALQNRRGKLFLFLFSGVQLSRKHGRQCIKHLSGYSGWKLRRLFRLRMSVILHFDEECDFIRIDRKRINCLDAIALFRKLVSIE